jgi:hypothetical protein
MEGDIPISRATDEREMSLMLCLPFSFLLSFFFFLGHGRPQPINSPTPFILTDEGTSPSGGSARLAAPGPLKWKNRVRGERDGDRVTERQWEEKKM